MSRPDPNPILYEGAPTSTGGMVDAARLCDMLGKRFDVQKPRSVYMHGWGVGFADAKPIRCTWELTLMDRHNRPVTFTFDLVDGESPLIVGLDFKRYANTYNRDMPRMIQFKRPSDVHVYTMYTYISDDQTGSPRLRLDIVPHPKSTLRTLMTTAERKELHMAKRIHRFGHASAMDMMKLMQPTGYDKASIKEACEKVCASCDICATSGRPADRRKISTTHINAAFNDEMQADFLYVYIRGHKHEILNMIDLGTRYGERAVTAARSAEEVKRTFETYWFYKHGAPNSFSAGHELCRPVLRKFLDAHGIKLNPRPSRSSHKVGRIERNIGVFRVVLDKMQKADTTANIHTLVARASFMTNLIHGSKLINSFHMARGYAPSILGIPKKIVTEDLLNAHIDREATRAMERIMRSKSPNTIDPGQLPEGTKVLLYYHSSKKNEPNEWITSTVIKAGEHILECRRKAKGPPMTIGYNEVRMMPKGELTKELMKYELEDDSPVVADVANPDTTTSFDEQRKTRTEDQQTKKTGAMNATKLTSERIEEIDSSLRERPEKDIGDTTIGTSEASGDIRSDQQKILRDIHRTIGN